VTASDTVATERLPDVEQDYGYYKFTRSDSLDRTYSISVRFILEEIVSPATANPEYSSYSASYGTDYTFGTIPLNNAANGGTTDTKKYMKNVSVGNPSAIQTRPDGTQFITRECTAIIPAYNASDASTHGDDFYIRIEPVFDWNDEGQLYNSMGTGTPASNTGEKIELKLKDNVLATPTWNTTSSTCGVWWSGLYASDAKQHNPRNNQNGGTVEIKDGAIVKIRTDSNNDGVINQADDVAKKVQQNAGRLFMVNDDDDNKNGKFDNQERPSDFNTPKNRSGNGGSVTVANENDLAQTELYVWMDCLTPQAGKTAPEVDVYLAGPQEFVIWTQSTKGQRLHYGKDDNNDNRMDYETTLTMLTASNLTYTRTVYVEANTMRPGMTQFGDILLKTDVIGSPLDGADDVRFTPVKVECTDMAFNHEPGTNSDGAMNLRKDGTANTEIVAPEWSVSPDATSGNDGNKNQKAVLYLPGKTVEVYARLKTTNIPAGTKVSVKANGKAIDASGKEVALSIP
jgi:hypothetical protein